MSDSPVKQAAVEYIRRGWKPVPMPHRQKKPILSEWQKLRLTEADVPTHFNGRPQNIGVLLGEPSGGLVDVDCDCGEAARLAPLILPQTSCVFGRTGNPRSHLLYVTEPVPEATQQWEDVGGQKIVELRSTGGQTVFPPSDHKETGEPIRFVDGVGEPPQVDGKLLSAMVSKLAAVAILARHWPAKGSRHDAAMALSGALARAGWDEGDIADVQEWVGRLVDDREIKDRRRTAETSVKKIAADKKCRGWPKLGELIGKEVASRAAEWLGIRFTSDDDLSWWDTRFDGVKIPPSNGNGKRQDTATKPARRPRLTDKGNGRRFALQHKGDARFCFPRNSWLIWDGTRFQRDVTGAVERMSKKTAESIWREAKDAKPDKRQAVLKWAAKSEMGERLSQMRKQAQSERGIPVLPEQLDSDPWLFNVANGTIDLRTGELLPHSRDRLITKIAPIAYDPSATCPLFLTFLDEIMGSKVDLVRFVHRVIGYTLSGVTTEQCFVLLYGTGANGKSTLLEIIRALMGDYGWEADFTTFLVKDSDQIRNDIAELRGARYVSAVEVTEGRQLSESLVKKLTGTDTIRARFLYQEAFNFRPEFKLWLACNHKPVIKGTDEGIWRRIRLVPFDVTFPPDKQDRTLLDKLKSELPGILAWAVRGCLDWQRNGDRLGEPADVGKATKTYRNEMDRIGAFIESCCVVGEAQGKPCVATAAQLYTRYKLWATLNDGGEPMTDTMFGRKLHERGCVRGFDQRKCVIWKGIGVKSENPDSG